MESVRLGLIGAGNMGSSHMRRFRAGDVKRCEVVAVCDCDPDRLEDFKEYKNYSDSRELIRSGEVDAVLIATPHYDHTTIGIDAFENNLHVLVEKPISVHKADAQRLIAAWKKSNNRVFGAMFQMRTEPVFKRIKKLIDDGELGEIQRTCWIASSWFRTEAYYASGGWRATWKGEGGGVLLNQCPHNLDLFQWMCGMPVTVRAFCGFGKYHNIEVEDEVTAYLQYPNGATGIFMASTGEAPGTDRLEIVGDRGKIVWENGKLSFKRNIISAKEFCRTSPERFATPEAWTIDIPIPDARRGHAVITQSFVDAILDGTPLIAPAEDGIRSVELANAMLYSAFTDQTVNIPIDVEAYEKKLKSLIAESKFEKGGVVKADDDFTKSFR